MKHQILGKKVRDKVSGLEGVAKGRCEYHRDETQILIKPNGLTDGKPIPSQWVDESDVEEIDDKF